MIHQCSLTRDRSASCKRGVVIYRARPYSSAERSTGADTKANDSNVKHPDCHTQYSCGAIARTQHFDEVPAVVFLRPKSNVDGGGLQQQSGILQRIAWHTSGHLLHLHLRNGGSLQLPQAVPVHLCIEAVRGEAERHMHDCALPLQLAASCKC